MRVILLTILLIAMSIDAHSRTSLTGNDLAFAMPRIVGDNEHTEMALHYEG